MTADIIRLASRYGRYGYRRITAMLKANPESGWRHPELDPLRLASCG